MQQTFGKASKTEDDEYASYKAEFRDMDKYYYKMHRAIKHFHDSLRSTSRRGVRMRGLGE